MLRRHFLLSAATFAVWASDASGQSPRVWRVGYVGSGSAARTVPVLRKALHNLGYEEGKNIHFDVREAKGDYAALPDLVREVVAARPDVIIAEATPAIASVQKATSTIPIVMCPATDPIGSGFVKSLARPGGNITGIANMYGDLTGKTLDFLHLVLPSAKKIGVLTSNNPTHPALFEEAKRGAQKLGISAERFIAATPNDLEVAFQAVKSANCDALYVLADPPRTKIPTLASEFAIPAIYQVDTYIQSGGLMSYGPDILDMFVKAAYYVDRILKGNSPADLPVEQPTTFRFLINLRAAKALGLTISESVLVQADQVIE